jgi:hypothetical protein
MHSNDGFPSARALGGEGGRSHGHAPPARVRPRLRENGLVAALSIRCQHCGALTSSRRRARSVARAPGGQKGRLTGSQRFNRKAEIGWRFQTS